MTASTVRVLDALAYVLALSGALLVLLACGPPDPARDGDPCSRDADCESGTCVSEFQDGVEVEGGLCTRECAYDPEAGDDDCGEDLVCLRYNPTGELLCFPECATWEDCRHDDGWTCQCISLGCLTRACVPPL